MKFVTLPNSIVLVLAILGGVAEYLNQTVIGLPVAWHNALLYGIFVITTFGVTIAVGKQLGIEIQTALHLTPAVIVAVTVLAYVVAAGVTTFGISGELKGIILGIVAFITTIFGPAPVLVPPPVPAPVPVAPAPPAPAA